jgi:hypothetical protein
LKAIPMYLLSVFTAPTRDFTKNQNKTEELIMERCIGQEEMGASGMGKTMLAKNQRWSRFARPTNKKRRLWRKVLVEMGQRQLNPMGKPVERKIFPQK